MPHLHHSVMQSDKFSFLLAAGFLLTTLVYLGGWGRLRSPSNIISVWRRVSGLLGLVSVWVAFASPIATMDHAMLTGHMIQHLLLMTIAAPLMWLGAPLIARGRRLPLALCWLAPTATLIVWHVPVVFMLGMRSETWHAVEELSFLSTGLLFWWPVVQRWPGVSGWSMILYLFLATLPCDILSGFLVFSERIAYPVYFLTARTSVLSVLADQQRAGALMWTSVTVVYFVAAAVLSAQSCSLQEGSLRARLYKNVF